ncbi:hypothetical protein ACFLYK_00485 [Candidatus Cloacimonadota bacterium]
MWYALIIIMLILGGIFGYQYYDKPDPGMQRFTEIVTDSDPIQLEQEGFKPITIDMRRGSVTLQPVAEYKIAGKVLSKKKYGSTWSAKVAPYDLAIGWASLTNSEYIDKLKFSQWGRFYFFKYEYNVPFREDYIIEHSSNNHIIPATDNLKKLLFHIKTDYLIEMEGYLVDISGKISNKPVTWKTSLKRDDTGNGSCELFYVNKITYDGIIYE